MCCTHVELQFIKDKTALRYYLVGKGFTQALKALGEAERIHTGFRKDLVTPELHHQLRICFTLIGLRLVDEEQFIIAALLHDVQEDYGIPSKDIEATYGSTVAEAVWLLTKKFKGAHKATEDYVSDLAKNKIASLVKAADRYDNLQSMIAVFTLEKMLDYIAFTTDVLLPALRQATKMFPEQMLAYTTMRKRLKDQLKLLDAYVALLKKVGPQHG